MLYLSVRAASQAAYISEHLSSKRGQHHTTVLILDLRNPANIYSNNLSLPFTIFLNMSSSSVILIRRGTRQNHRLISFVVARGLSRSSRSSYSQQIYSTYKKLNGYCTFSLDLSFIILNLNISHQFTKNIQGVPAKVPRFVLFVEIATIG